MSRDKRVRNFELLAQRLFNVPLMIEPTKAEMICAALQQRLGIVKFDRIDGTTLGAAEMQALAGDARRSYGDDFKLYHMDGQIAVIPIEGTLVHKFGWLDPISGMTGYDGIARKLRAAMADNDVKAIWLDIDSPGGGSLAASRWHRKSLFVLNLRVESRYGPLLTSRHAARPMRSLAFVIVSTALTMPSQDPSVHM